MRDLAKARKNPYARRLKEAVPATTKLPLKSTSYFQTIRSRPDRAMIKDEWILRVLSAPDNEQIQEDGRIRRWRRIPEADGRYLRVLLPDGETVHNAFFDRGFKP